MSRLKFGMWLFLATEVLIFGGFFVLYAWSRIHQEVGFEIGSRHMNLWVGAANTAVLLTSSLAMAIAVEKKKYRRPALAMTGLLGSVFLAVKAFEYSEHYREGFFPGFQFTYAGEHANQVYAFMSFYLLGTALHAVHMLIGLALVAWIFWKSDREEAVENVGLYWHFIDIVWVFLFPAFYLIGSR